MLCVVSYDIPSDKAGNRRRRQLHKFLEGHGDRVQYSVFEIRCQDKNELQQIVSKIERILESAHDLVRLYPFHEDTEKEIIILGEGELFKIEDGYFF